MSNMSKKEELILSGQDFYTVSDSYIELYYQMPKWIFKGPYKDLSNNDRVAYTLLKDRNEVSRINGWHDLQGRLFFVYTVEELCNILGLSKSTVIKVKQNLEKHGLIYQETNMFDAKIQKKQPNRIYLLKPHFEATDIASKAKKSPSALQSHEGLKTRPKEQVDKSLQPHEGLKTRPSEKPTSALQPHEGLKTRPHQYNIISFIDDDDTKRIINKLNEAGMPFAYSGKVAKNQAVTLQRLIKKADKETINKLIDRIIDTNIKTDVVNYLIKSLKNDKNKPATSKSKQYRGNNKRVEKGTDWSKKKAKHEGMSIDKLKEIFSQLKNE